MEMIMDYIQIEGDYIRIKHITSPSVLLMVLQHIVYFDKTQYINDSEIVFKKTFIVYNVENDDELVIGIDGYFSLTNKHQFYHLLEDGVCLELIKKISKGDTMIFVRRGFDNNYRLKNNVCAEDVLSFLNGDDGYEEGGAIVGNSLQKRLLNKDCIFMEDEQSHLLTIHDDGKSFPVSMETFKRKLEETVSGRVIKRNLL